MTAFVELPAAGGGTFDQDANLRSARRCAPGSSGRLVPLLFAGCGSGDESTARPAAPAAFGERQAASGAAGRDRHDRVERRCGRGHGQPGWSRPRRSPGRPRRPAPTLATAVLLVGHRVRGRVSRGTSLAIQINSSAAFIFKSGRRRDARRGVHHPERPADPQDIAAGSPAGTHVVELHRQTEGSQGVWQLLAVGVPTAAPRQPLRRRPGNLIEVIGDLDRHRIQNGSGRSANTDCFPTESH